MGRPSPNGGTGKGGGLTSWGGGIKSRTSFPKDGSDYDAQRDTNARTMHYPAAYIHKGIKIVGSKAAPYKGVDFVSPQGNEQRDAR